MIKTEDYRLAAEIDNQLEPLFCALKYSIDVQKCINFFHISVVRRDGEAIAQSEILPVLRKKFVLVDSAIFAHDRLYFKIAK